MSNQRGPQISHACKLLHVMIVDDHDLFCRGLYHLLSGIDDFEVVAEAHSYSDTLAQLAIMPIDVVVLDLCLPDAESIAVVRRLSALTPPPQVVILSQVMDEQVLLQALLAGASGYLTKDTPDSDVVSALQGLKRDELAMLPRVAARAVRLLVDTCHEVETSSITQLPYEPRPVIVSPPHTSDIAESSVDALMHVLTRQEYKVMQLMRQGLSNKQIAVHLTISPYTVGKYIQNIFHKLGVTNRTQAATVFEGEQIRGSEPV